MLTEFNLTVFDIKVTCYTSWLYKIGTYLNFQKTLYLVDPKNVKRTDLFLVLRDIMFGYYNLSLNVKNCVVLKKN